MPQDFSNLFKKVTILPFTTLVKKAMKMSPQTTGDTLHSNCNLTFFAGKNCRVPVVTILQQRKEKVKRQKECVFMPKTSHYYQVRVGRDVAPPAGGDHTAAGAAARTQARTCTKCAPDHVPANSVSGNLSRAAVKCKHAPATACEPARGIVTSGRGKKCATRQKKAPQRHDSPWGDIFGGCPQNAIKNQYL